MREIFKIYINSKLYPVFDIPDKKHNGNNGDPDTWWLYYNDLPNGISPDKDSSYLVPYCSKSMPRQVWNISFSQRTYSKIKYGDYDFRTTGFVEMKVNGNLIYSFGCYDMDFAFSKIGYLKVILQEHVFNFFNPIEENGRKIYYHNLPAKIGISKHGNPWEIKVYPDCSEEELEDWWESYWNSKPHDDKEWIDIEKGYFYDAKRAGYINHGDALEDGNINWFRV